MSGDIEKHQFAVRTSDFVRFLEEKTLDQPCPACGACQWTLIGPKDDGITFMLRTALRGASSPTQVTTVAVYCNECGFLRQHLAKVVRNWVDANPAPDQLEFEGAEFDGDQ